MKHILFIIALGALTQSCKEKQSEVILIEPVSDNVAKIPEYMPTEIDTVFVPAVDTCSMLRKRFDSITNELFIVKYKVARVKYYLAIVNKKPSQAKFLRGWITRAVK